MLGPIFNREVLTVPRRSRHYTARALYLLILWVLTVTAWQATFGALGLGVGVSQGDLAYFGALIFQVLSFLELTLVMFFAALFAASAITLEKDRRTFILLLLTDLSNAEIVLGKLFGNLLHILTLVVCAIPVLALTILLGGVAGQQVILASVVLVASAVAAGSLGALIALWRDKTFQTLAMTVLALVLYLLLAEALAAVPGLEGLAPVVNPFRTLQSVIDQDVTTAEGLPPVAGFTALMLAVSAGLNGLGLWKLRVWNPSGEPIIQRDAPDEAEKEAMEKAAAVARNIHAAPGQARPVWPNPILWREVATRAYGARGLLIKLGYLAVVGLICYAAVATLPPPGRADRYLLALGLVPVVQLSLLLLNAQAVTAITTERDLKALELLLVTDLRPPELLFGKLGGILWNTKEIVLPPLLLVGWFMLRGYVGVETGFYLLISLVVLIAFTATLGVHIGLRMVNTRVAIGQSLGTVFFLFLGTLLAIYLILVSGRFEGQWTSFLAFLAIGIGGLWFVLGGRSPSGAIRIAAIACPLAMFYVVLSAVIGNPRTGQAGDPLPPFLLLTGSFGFTVAAMLVPLLSEFEVALGYKAPVDEE
jgi:ABC-type Na+ efflux pump permease subunit